MIQIYFLVLCGSFITCTRQKAAKSPAQIVADKIRYHRDLDSRFVVIKVNNGSLIFRQGEVGKACGDVVAVVGLHVIMQFVRLQFYVVRCLCVPS